jgi:hypothetical protein
MALLEQVERREKNRNEEDREWKRLSSGQVFWTSLLARLEY